MNIQQLFDHFLEYKKPVCKASSLGNYRVKYRKLCDTSIIDPQTDIEEIDSQWLQGVYEKCKASGLSEKTCRDTITLMKNILNTGAALGVTSHKVMLVQYSKEGYVNKEKLKVYKKDEVQKIVNWLELNPHFWTLGIYIGIYTGARIGEICGLKWQDVDFVEKTIHVQRTIERGVAVEGRGTVVYINTTKTESSNRLLPISSGIEKKLRDWSRVSRPEFYITSNSVSPIEPRLLRERFVKICKETGVKYKGFHSLRHTFATMMLEAGTDIKTISDILGHSSVEITMDVYSHPSDNAKRKAVNKTFRNLKLE